MFLGPVNGYIAANRNREDGIVTDMKGRIETMGRLLRIAMFLAISGTCGVNTATAGDASSQQMAVVAFGDSTTAPRENVVVYATLLEKALAAKGIPAKVINAGVGGNTTVRGRARFEKDVVSHNPNLVIIQFGLNDAAVDVWKKTPATQPRVSPEQYEKNLRYFVETLKARGTDAILMTPNASRWTEEIKQMYGKPPYQPDNPDGFNVLVSRYAEIVRQVARQERVALVDVYAAFQAYGKESGQSLGDLLLDAMHPNSKGHEVIVEMLLSTKPIGVRLKPDLSRNSP
jgi:lysophospholipase L1-like esterase